VTAGHDGVVRSWDASRDLPPITVARFSGPVDTVALRSDRTLACSERNAVHVIAPDGRELARAVGHAGELSQAVPTADGHVISADLDGGIQVRAIDNGVVSRWSAGVGETRQLAVSPAGRVAFATRDANWRWDSTTGKASLLAQHRGITGLAWVGEDRIASVAHDGKISLYDASSGAVAAELVTTSPLSSVAVSPDATRIAAGATNGLIHVWTPHGADQKLDTDGQTIEDLAFSADGRAIVSVGRTGAVRIIPLDGSPAHTLPVTTGVVFAVAVDPRGRWIATGGDDRWIRIWDAASGSPVTSWPGHRDTVFHLAFALDGSLISVGDSTIASWDLSAIAGERVIDVGSPIVAAAALEDAFAIGTNDGELRIIRIADGATIAARATKRQVFSIAIDGSRVASGHSDGTIAISDARDLSAVQSWREPNDLAEGVRALAFDHQSRLVWGTDNGRLAVRDLASSTSVELRDHGDPVLKVAVSPIADTVLVGTEAGVLESWSDGHLVSQLRPLGVITSLAWAPDGRHAACVGLEHRLVVISAGVSQPLPDLQTPDFDIGGSVAYSRSGDLIATGAATGPTPGRVAIWNTRGKQLATLDGHTRPISGLGFSADGRLLITASQDGTIRIWDLSVLRAAPGELLARLTRNAGLVVAQSAVILDPALFATRLERVP
jgi:WD40 repeat protein